jgi:hypothetical protein
MKIYEEVHRKLYTLFLNPALHGSVVILLCSMEEPWTRQVVDLRAVLKKGGEGSSKGFNIEML